MVSRSRRNLKKGEPVPRRSSSPRLRMGLKTKLRSQQKLQILHRTLMEEYRHRMSS